jgi:hypothetical protein
MSPEELENFLEDFKKNPTVGNDSSFGMLRQLTLYLVERLLTLQKDNGSTSSE